ncbi:MAG TPA: D-alanyl-D-alanine carboxypeptidase family protein [Dehalococcoidia bacterium]|nr:D-alanyl-D-alanine carboxypeptidase family protein [Dehalococcoidia bacterium]
MQGKRRNLRVPGLLLLTAALAFGWTNVHGKTTNNPEPMSGGGGPPVAAAASIAPAQPLAAPAPPPLLSGFAAPAAWASAPTLKPTAPIPPQVIGIAAVVIDEASGEVLFDKYAHQALPPASLTKIATLVLALEYGRLDEEIVSDVDSTTMRGSTVMGLEVGDRFSLRDLLYGLMLPSGNDAALAIGRHIAGSDAAFVAMLNNLMARLALRDSNFMNPHGLGGGTTLHVASAYDLAMLSRYGMSLPGFKEIVTAGAWTARGSRTIRFANINSFLYAYSGADGIKTGYTRGAGPTLAASATRNSHRLFAVVLNSSARDADARSLLNWAFSGYDWPQ